MPVRIQRKRTKGWKMPATSVYVGRPTKWGNPFRVGGYFKIGGSSGVANFQWLWCEAYKAESGFEEMETPEQCIEWYRRLVNISRRFDLDELRGKDLACWCPLDKPCHADVLLELANKQT